MGTRIDWWGSRVGALACRVARPGRKKDGRRAVAEQTFPKGKIAGVSGKGKGTASKKKTRQPEKRDT